MRKVMLLLAVMCLLASGASGQGFWSSLFGGSPSYSYSDSVNTDSSIWRAPMNVQVKAISTKAAGTVKVLTVNGDSSVLRMAAGQQVTLNIAIVFKTGTDTALRHGNLTVFGNTTSRPLPATAPALSSPTNAATGQARTQVKLSWAAVNFAKNYALQVSTVSTFASTVFDTAGIRGTFGVISKTLNAAQAYYWHVRDTAQTAVSAWSSVWRFTTIAAAPGTPTLALPTNGAAGLGLSVTLSWASGAGTAPTSYIVSVSEHSSYTLPVIYQSGITGTSKAVSGLFGLRNYYWHVREVNASGTGAWSSGWSFTPAIPTPTLVSPSNGATGSKSTVTLLWHKPDGDARQIFGGEGYKYYYEILDSIGGVICAQRMDLYDTFLTCDNATTNHATYSWHISAGNDSGTSAWSVTWSFTTTDSTPAVPALSSPTNGATGINHYTGATLSWATAAYASAYAVQVSTASNFASTAIYDTSTAIRTKATGALSPATKYYWHVLGKNHFGVSAWATARSFTTGN